MYALNRTSCCVFAAALIAWFLASAAVSATDKSGATPARRAAITDFGAVADGKTLNTAHIQSAIDELAKKGGGTVVIPQGVFLSGAIFLKPGVNVYLEEGAVLKGSTEICNYPKMKTRIEGQFVDWIPALINADGCDHLS